MPPPECERGWNFRRGIAYEFTNTVPNHGIDGEEIMKWLSRVLATFAFFSVPAVAANQQTPPLSAQAQHRVAWVIRPPSTRFRRCIQLVDWCVTGGYATSCNPVNLFATRLIAGLSPRSSRSCRTWHEGIRCTREGRFPPAGERNRVPMSARL